MTLPADVRETLREALDYAARAIREYTYFSEASEAFRISRLTSVEKARQWLREQA